VLECLKRLPRGEAAYYRIRRVDPRRISEAEAAARFIYLNKYCFNGLYRTNKRGIFNVPYGPPKSGRPPDEQLIISAASVLQRAMLISGDFEETISYAEPGDFVYLDPPYITRARRVFSEYLSNTFTGLDLERFGACLESLHKRDVAFLVSYADTPEARVLLAPWTPRRMWTQRNIAGFVGSRKGVYELVATNVRS
jgi:DNA adenine methylase